MNRTSITDPLQIAEIATPVPGLIGVTICPGKQQPHAFSGSWARDLALDLAAIAEWGKLGTSGAPIICTLMTMQELSRFGVSNLGEAAREHGFDWFHLPIPDQGA